MVILVVLVFVLLGIFGMSFMCRCLFCVVLVSIVVSFLVSVCGLVMFLVVVCSLGLMFLMCFGKM